MTTRSALHKIAIAACLMAAPAAFAQAPVPPAPDALPAPVNAPPPPPSAVKIPPSAPTAGKFYAYAGIAAFAPDSSSQLQHQHGDTAAFIGGGGYRFTDLFALQGDLFASGQKLDTPPGAAPAAGTFAPGTLKTHMYTTGLAVTAKFNFPSGRWEPYVAGGGGIYSTLFRTTSEDTTCQHRCADTGPRVSSRSNDFGYHAALGLDFHITQKDVIGGELRYLGLKSSFDDIGVGKVNSGGLFAWVGYRRYF
jgi:opacity protein-like surface antigen